MAVPVVESIATTANASVGTSVVATAPSSITSGDLLVAQVVVRKNPGTVVPPTDWTLIDFIGSTSGNNYLYSYWKAATGSEPANYTWSWDNSEYAGAGILRLSGADTTTPVDVYGIAEGVLTTTVTVASITTTVDDCLLIAFFSANNATRTMTLPSGYTSQWLDIATGGGTAGAAYDGVTKSQASAGSTGSVDGVFNGLTQPRGQLIAIAPSGGGGGPTVPALLEGGMLRGGLHNMSGGL